MNRKLKTPPVTPNSGDDCILDSLVPFYVVTDDGVSCEPIPESQTMRVPQDGARLELRNLAKYGAGMMPEDYIPVNNLDAMQTASAVTEFCSRMNSELEKQTPKTENNGLDNEPF